MTSEHFFSSLPVIPTAIHYCLKVEDIFSRIHDNGRDHTGILLLEIQAANLALLGEV